MTHPSWTMVETNRLILRRWESKDLEPFAQMNADPKVMEFFPAPLTPQETAAGVQIMQEKFERNGFSFCATELKSTGEFIGFIGLNIPSFEAPFMPCVEIGWRLSHAYWGQGYAQEGARAALSWGFEMRGFEEIVSFTPVHNTRSRHVMERIGMSRVPQEDFDHPKLPDHHPLKRHVLYKIRKLSLKKELSAE